MQQHFLNEKLWSRLLDTLDCYDIPITGDDFERKRSWLLLATACGMQLAMRLTRDEWMDVDVRLGNYGTAGEVDIRFHVTRMDRDGGIEFQVPARIFFQQPDLTEQFEVFVGEKATPVSFQSMAYDSEYTASDLARRMAAKFDEYYLEWWIVEQLGYEEATLGER